MSARHTPGPWRWEINRKSKSIHIVGGRPQYDKTVMDFERWGMYRAAPRFNEAIAGDEYNIMTRVSDRPDWIVPFEGRSHHADWCAAVLHPDARLMAAAPELLASLRDCALVMQNELNGLAVIQPELRGALAAIAKATGETL